MIEIEVFDDMKDKRELINPTEMFETEHGTTFQQYYRGLPQKVYWISCGLCEKAIVNIWWDDEKDCYQLSTDNKKTLKEFNSFVKAKEIKAKVGLELEVL